MRKLILAAVVVMVAVPAGAADADTICATLYTYLAQSAHSNGMSGANFEAAALKAEDAHLALNPTEERERYAFGVVDGAQTIRDGLARGAITSGTVMMTATRCNSHYFPTMAAGQQLVYPDEWWGH